jgi:arylsulfatase A-like enzyme
MGHEHIQTPHIDQLAEEGIAFTRGYVKNITFPHLLDYY